MQQRTPNQTAVIEASGHISLTANAGSGKTSVLTDRFISIVIDRGIPLKNVAAITFTNKAASELYNRVAANLEERLKNATDFEERRRLEDIRKQLISANICTISSFCTELLREFPAEAGIDPGFIVLDEYGTTNLISDCVTAVQKNPQQKNSFDLISRAFGGPKNAVSILIQMTADREAIAMTEHKLYAGSNDEISAGLKKICTDLLNPVIDLCIPALDAIIAIHKSNRNSKAKKVPDVEALYIKFLAPQSNAGKIKLAKNMADIMFVDKWLKFRAAYLKDDSVFKELHRTVFELKDEIELVNEFFDDSGNPDTSTIEKAVAIISPLLELYRETGRLYRSKKSTAGFIDFTDMQLMMRELLRDNGVRGELAGRFQYIMVDEYQDTNEIQYEIFLPLLKELREGNLFVVGDEKQSIYMFRNADIEMFERTRNDIAQKNPEGIKSLPDSFRMAPALCLFLNKLFENIFAMPNKLFNEVGHEETICAREKNFDGHIELLLCNGKNEQPETELVTAKILQLKKEVPELKWNDIAIFCRTKKHLEYYREIFSRHGIPFTIYGGKGYYQSQSIQDILNYIRFLIDSRDDVALTGLLRSPFFMIPDTDIMNIVYSDGGSLFDKLNRYSGNQPGNTAVRKAADILIRHLKTAGTGSITGTLSAILEETPFLSIIGNRPDALQQLANIDKLMNIAREFEMEGYHILYDFAEYLIRFTEEEENEAFANMETGTETVQLMSIHAAKGLQFRVVFLINANAGFLGNEKYKAIKTDKNVGLYFDIPGSEDFFSARRKTLLSRLAAYLSKRRTIAEQKRLLYVALTRAEEYLFIAGSATTITPKISDNSYLEFITRVFDNPLETSSIALNGIVKRLIKKDDGFADSETEIKQSIPVTTSLQLPEAPPRSEAEKNFRVDINPPGKIAVHPRISVSQFTMFSDCPVKYRLFYRLKLGEFAAQDSKLFSSFDKTAGATDAKAVTASVRGTILHAMLEKNITDDDAESAAEKLASAIMEISPLPQNISSQLKPVAEQYRRFANSAEYKKILSFTGFKTEFRFASAEDGYSLQGVADRIIVEKDKIIIIDYKSDAKPDTGGGGKSSHYVIQTKIYAYLASKYFTAFNNFETRILFIAEPDNPIIHSYTRNDFDSLTVPLKAMATAIQNSEYQPERSHCTVCLFAKKDGSCISEKQVSGQPA